MTTASLIITTYNRPDALKAVLHTAVKQTVLPREVIVADDGSTSETKEIVEQFASSVSVPVHHAWQEDKGFRAARIRNLGALKASADLLIYIDGDILLHPAFVEDHLRAHRPGRFVKGSRCLLTPGLTAELIDSPGKVPGLWSRGVLGRFKSFCHPWASRCFSSLGGGWDNIRTCNLSVDRVDFERVNGFHEGFVGWGLEDTEFAARLVFAGCERLNLRFGAVGWHLHHKEEPRDALPRNQELLQNTLSQRLRVASTGLRECQ